MESIHTHRGFTLIELLVVTAIILVVTAITITSQASFNKTVILANTAYDIALATRSAENFGLGGHSNNNSIENVGYGVHFDIGEQNSFLIFADTYTGSGGSCHPPGSVLDSPDTIYGDCVYTAGKDTLVNPYTLENGITINDLCVQKNSSWTCGQLTLDVVFSRPNGDAIISSNGSVPPPSSPYTKACIAVISPQGGVRAVLIDTLGEINVDNSPCPS